MGFRGIDVRQTGDVLVFRALLLDSLGEKVTAGQALLYLYEVQRDGSLKSFDFKDKSFKTTSCGYETLNLVQQAGNGGATNTGIWTAAFEPLKEEESQSSYSGADSLSSESSPADETPFTKGNVYIAMVNHASAAPVWQGREFQYGEAEGDGLAAIADAVLLRDWTDTIADADAAVAARCLLQAARFLRNKFSTTASPGDVTVYEEDDTTPAYTKSVTTDPAAEPIVEG